MEKIETQILNTTTTPETVVNTKDIGSDLYEIRIRGTGFVLVAKKKIWILVAIYTSSLVNTIEQEVDEEADLRGGLMVVNTIELEVDEEGDLIKIDES